MDARWTAYGVHIGVWDNVDVGWDRLIGALPPGASAEPGQDLDVTYSLDQTDARETPSATADFVLRRDDDLIFRTPDPDSLLYALQADSEWQVAVRAREYSFVHAGAVAYEGRGLLLPGVSGAGKSTLVSELLALGATYYSDEYAVLDENGLLHPFPCMLKLKDRPPTGRRVRPEEFGAVAAHDPVWIDLIAFPTYLSDTSFQAEEIPTMRSSLHLLEHMPAAQLKPAEALGVVAHVTDRCSCISVRYADSSTAARELIHRLTSQS